MSLSGININKKQMNLLGGGQLSINQGTRPLTANTAQVGWGETFSWPPSALISPPLPPSSSGLSPSSFGANPGLEGGAVLGAEDLASFAAPFVSFCASKGSEWPSTHPCPGSTVQHQVVGTRCGLFLRWQLPYCGGHLLEL